MKSQLTEKQPFSFFPDKDESGLIGTATPQALLEIYCRQTGMVGRFTHELLIQGRPDVAREVLLTFILQESPGYLYILVNELAECAATMQSILGQSKEEASDFVNQVVDLANDLLTFAKLDANAILDAADQMVQAYDQIVNSGHSMIAGKNALIN